jgi:hypothetical protein
MAKINHKYLIQVNFYGQTTLKIILTKQFYHQNSGGNNSFKDFENGNPCWFYPFSIQTQ